jgi:hypothetical protein
MAPNGTVANCPGLSPNGQNFDVARVNEMIARADEIVARADLPRGGALVSD